MFVNDNGFEITSINYNAERNHITEGALVGIVLGWLIGIIGFYILGICIIRMYLKRFHGR